MSLLIGPAFYYQIKDESACVLACRTADEFVEIPEYIEGFPVTQIAPYAFSERRMELVGGRWTEDFPRGEEPPLLCGTRLSGIVLPPSIEKIGNYGFYNCYDLGYLACSSAIHDLGSGLFTGCGSLSHIAIQVDRGRRSCLKEMLSELRQAVTVDYREARERALLIFPEFYEEALENTPARITITTTHGCGHRYRYCFEQTHFLFREYDAQFPYACSQEGPALAVRLALGRLRYPMGLSLDAEKIYRGYVEEHWKETGLEVIKAKPGKGGEFQTPAGVREPSALEWLLSAFHPDEEKTGRLIRLAERVLAREAMSCLMDYRHRNFKAEKRRFEL